MFLDNAHPITGRMVGVVNRSGRGFRLKISIKKEEYNHFGFYLEIPQKQSFVSATADTGCQSCLAGIKIVKKLGLSTKDLIPVNLKMHAHSRQS